MHKKILALCAIVALVMAFVPAMADAAPPQKLKDVVGEAIVMAADEHVSDNDDHTGYYFSAGWHSKTFDNSWEWVIGSDTTYANVAYMPGIGLVAAYEKTGDSSYLATAMNAADSMIAHYNGTVPNDRPYAQDVEFLAQLARVTGNANYWQAAHDLYARLISDFPDPNDNVDRHIPVRYSMAGWDIAAHVRAAWLSGHEDYSLAQLDRIIERHDDWAEVMYPGVGDVTNASYGSLLWAMGMVGADYEIADMFVDALVSSQQSDGLWDDDWQTTAFAVLGLNGAPQRPPVQMAMTQGVTALADAQHDDGGWFYTDDGVDYDYGEINGECLAAMSWARVNNGKHKGFSDPNPDNGNDRHPLDPVN